MAEWIFCVDVRKTMAQVQDGPILICGRVKFLPRSKVRGLIPGRANCGYLADRILFGCGNVDGSTPGRANFTISPSEFYRLDVQRALVQFQGWPISLRGRVNLLLRMRKAPWFNSRAGQFFFADGWIFLFRCARAAGSNPGRVDFAIWPSGFSCLYVQMSMVQFQDGPD